MFDVFKKSYVRNLFAALLLVAGNAINFWGMTAEKALMTPAAAAAPVMGRILLGGRFGGRYDEKALRAVQAKLGEVQILRGEEVLATLKSETGNFSRVCFGPESLVVGHLTHGGGVRIWNWKTSKEIFRLQDEVNGVVGFTPQGNLVIYPGNNSPTDHIYRRQGNTWVYDGLVDRSVREKVIGFYKP